MKQARLAVKLSRRGLSRLAGMADTAVWNLEEGRIPGLDTLERIAIMLGVPACWLAYGEEGVLPFIEKRPRMERPERKAYAFRETPVAEAADAPPVPRSLACYDVGRRLQEAREARGLSRKELGRESATSDTTVRQTEEAEIIPGLDTAEQLARALDVSPCWLAFGDL